MPAPRDDNAVVRRSLVPPRAARSLWTSALWTGAATALVAALVSVIAVAALWLPAAGSAGNAGSAVRAGLLTFLAGLHGGITVDGLNSAFVPLGLTLAIAALAWRAGTGLADAAEDLDERAPGRLVAALGVQAAAFAVVCTVAGRVATLGTSSVPGVGVALGALLLFGVPAGAAMVRSSPMRAALAALSSPSMMSAVRAAVVVVAVYLLGGALLVGGSLADHHARVESLSHQVGGGFAGLPILVLGALAAPNAAIAGASYLAGPGFAVGNHNAVTLWSGAHGTVPAFPLLGALPAGAAGMWGWLLALLTLAAAGGGSALMVDRTLGSRSFGARTAVLARAAGLAAVAMLLLTWQGGGAIGSGHLAAVGASPWQGALALAAITLLGGCVGLGLLALCRAVRGKHFVAAPIRALVDRADAASGMLEASHSVVDYGHRRATGGGVRSTLRSVAAAVTVTDAERRADAGQQAGLDTEITAPVPRIADGDEAGLTRRDKPDRDKRAG